MPRLTRKYILDRTEERTVGSYTCWVWTGSLTGNGYARGKEGTQPHREAYELWIGPIPFGAQLDHRCRNHACCNPDHLKPVTRAGNQRLGDQARRGQMPKKQLRVARMLHNMVVNR